MENNQSQTTKSFVEQLKEQAKKGLATGVGIAALVAPIIIVVNIAGWFGKKD